MNFEFTKEEQAFIERVRDFLKREAEKDYASEIMAPEREGHAQLADSEERREFCRQLGKAGFLGLTWPREYGGKELPGIYDYLVNEELASVGAPLIGKGVGIIGKTLMHHGSDKLKREFLPKILNAEVEFALGYSEPGAGSDLASMKLKAERDGDGWRLNGQKTWNTSANFADWYWLAARTDSTGPKHKGITLFMLPLDQKGITVRAIETMAAHRTNEVFFDDVWVSDDYVVGEVNKGWSYICEALDYERFALYTFGPVKLKLDALVELLKNTERNGKPLAQHEHVQRVLARLSTRVEAAKGLQRKVICAAAQGRVPTVESAMCKLCSTELGQDISNAAMDLLGPEALLSHSAPGNVGDGAWENSLRGTVVDTIGGGTSQIQKNIIARRHLQLPNPS
ncbi:acyl-CoA dehydrogenase [Pseudomaricurvus alkylphenolicus]|uniref:acyl-CoA dehydrogenase family protein n=1 Tax=Pseudomaricurvus alkylphenolicus TaxID=1306991 RepID=UPI0014249CE1|nr:acyl-CoA dehydrogenase family protein [Pseudomaricurvus alkylphenolicus]NIB38330.1 acyl-CoA dehydrogenase [Pseudomaricurvus alkylphenolicus]